MISTTMRQAAVMSALVTAAVLLTGAAAFSATGPSQPQRRVVLVLGGYVLADQHPIPGCDPGSEGSFDQGQPAGHALHWLLPHLQQPLAAVSRT